MNMTDIRTAKGLELTRQGTITTVRADGRLLRFFTIPLCKLVLEIFKAVMWLRLCEFDVVHL